MDQILDKGKEIFQLGITQNNKQEINLGCALLGHLNVQEDLTQNIKNYFSTKLQTELNQLQFVLEIKENYDFPFFKFYVKLLELMADVIQQYKDNVLQNSEPDILLDILRFQIDEILDDKLRQLFDEFIEYFQDKAITFLDNFCEEVAQISNQNENFIRFLLDIFKEKAEDKIDYFQNQISQFQMNLRIMKLLDAYLIQQQKLSKYQLQHIVDHSNQINKTLNFDSHFFSQFKNLTESLDNQNELLEFVDDIFLLAQNCVNRSISTLSRNYICAMTNYLSDTFFGQNVFHVMKSLFNKYVNKDYISSNYIYFKSSPTTYNVLLISLFNCLITFQEHFLVKFLIRNQNNHGYKNMKSGLTINQKW